MQACTKTHHFEIKNAKIFWGGGHIDISRYWSFTDV